ncbi:BTB/POZ domain-containing adapter for CUL3-mediated RhoA degradation protein 3 [Amphibalanus amphitrite]|uniref:BTB/POZ domain-containing adapter for CUL3-mediated RhoA degradation protein 3 n=1 Tax=Amphibalanus amphitrite TaxID=1232801 RepID=A0A6A4W4H6_AMPAM|nr:BTB/POZ domain-containing adapter for CUL3-mediated RhoA degradation protein 3 [Amphibalanus amphitrite]
MSGDQRTMIKGSPSQYVKLNVGGTLYYATIATLTKYDNMLKAMFSGRMEVLTDSEGWILVDRCGKHFGTVLNYLRDGTVTLPDTARELAELYTEAKYYCIQELGEACDSALKKLTDRDVQPICRIPLITSSREEHQLISQSTKPVVKLLINRHNNKYSYTSASDDNMLKNLEMFDKLSLRFSHRVLFIKDVTATNEICMWTFYGRGQKVAEVCCTSIVYATDKKHTKVECHEARIYEETLNIMLYEACDSPDAELMQATARRPAAAFGCTSDDDEPAAAAAAGARSKHGLDRLRSNKQAAHAHAVPPPPAPPL